MAAVGTAVPGNVNLAKQKPYAVSAYSRRVKSLANNAQSFGPDSYVNITLDTSTPGSFLDPLQSYLKWDLTIRNTNVFADFVSFGQAGAASLIEEFRIYIQGTPIEEILQYNVFYELAMNQNGQCQQPFELFRSNKNAQPIASIFHANAIKPPMVDLEGRPMYGRVVKPKTTTSVTYASTAATKLLGATMIGSQATMSTKVCFSGCRPYFTTGIGANTINLVADAQSLLYGVGTTIPTAAVINGSTEITNAIANGQALFPGYYRNASDASVQQVNTAISANEPSYLTTASGALDLYNSRVTTTAPGGTNSVFSSYIQTANGGILPYGGTSVEFPSVFNQSAAEVDPDIDPLNPLNWSSILPPSIIRPELKTLGPQNLQDYFMFLANCKYLPIGMPGWDKNDPNAWDTAKQIPADYNITSNNFRNLKQYVGANNERTFTYTCCIPLISGVLGSFAEKCWPTMLVAPGSMYIQIRTASPGKAFQVSMDPCRRVLGTIRDYLPFGGSLGGLFGQVGAPVSSQLASGSLTNQSVIYNQDGNFPENPVGFLPRNTFSKYQAVQSWEYNAVSGISGTMDNRKVQSTVNAYACIGSTLGSANISYNSTYLSAGSYATKGFGLLFRPYSVAAMEGRWTIGRAYVAQSTACTQVNGENTYIRSRVITEEGTMIIPSNQNVGTNIAPTNTLATFISGSATNPDAIVYPISTLGSGSIVSASVCPRMSINNVGNDSQYAATAGWAPDADVTVEFSPSGMPLPQYWLHAQPWTKKTFAMSTVTSEGDAPGVIQIKYVGETQIDVANESRACYGTFLSASVPQCRRVFTNSSTNPGGITYSLSNIEFVSQQIILPDSVSASILEDAAQGDISISSNSLHNYQTPIAQSVSQNLIIPAKIASANTMYCLFQPQAFVSGNEAYCYNSLRGICPFGAISVNSGMTRSGLLGDYGAYGLGFDADQLRIQNVPCSNGALQVQLKIGNELLPQQPLTTISEIVSENIKAQHKLFDTSSNVNTTFMLSGKSDYTLGGSEFSALSYDVLAPETFCATFVSAELMDDQTAINNPAMTYVYACEANAKSTATTTPADFVIARRPYQLEMFQPPASTFVLAFDLDTWSRFSDVTRSGKFLGNNTITLTMQNAVALGYAPGQVLSSGYVLQTFIVHDIRFSFQAGGSVVSYY